LEVHLGASSAPCQQRRSGGDRVAGDPQGLPGLEGECLGDVPHNRLLDGLLLAAPKHARRKRRRLSGLLIIDYLFHLPLEITAMVLAYCAFSIFRSWRSGKLAEAMSDDAAQ
jgi:hypothetical protein